MRQCRYESFDATTNTPPPIACTFYFPTARTVAVGTPSIRQGAPSLVMRMSEAPHTNTAHGVTRISMPTGRAMIISMCPHTPSHTHTRSGSGANISMRTLMMAPFLSRSGFLDFRCLAAPPGDAAAATAFCACFAWRFSSSSFSPEQTAGGALETRCREDMRMHA